MTAELDHDEEALEGGNRSHYGQQETRQGKGREGNG
jgi:hypothetical protein